jgi:hypothetical protein
VTEGQRSIDAAIAEVENLRRVLKRQTSTQVQSEEERQIIKATALSWFNGHRGVIEPFVGGENLKPLDDLYRHLLDAAARGTLRTKYIVGFKEIKKRFISLQTDHVINLSKAPTTAGAPGAVSDPAPQFTPLISDPKMQLILQKRWQECVICVKSGAPLGATVMMGGILEGLLLARINQLPNKAPVNTAATAPRDKATGKTLLLKDWGLKNFIDVAHELKWITTTAKDIGEVLRDYRNYIHPQKEFSHGVSLTPGDAEMLWNIAKSIIVQVLKP